MSEDTINLILQIVLLLLGGSVTGGALYFGGKRSGIKAISDENKQLAEHYEQRYNEANEARLKLVAQVDQLEVERKQQAEQITDIKARLTILTDEYEKRQDADLARFAEYMKGQGKQEAQLEAMQRELTDLKTRFEAIKSENNELRPLRELTLQQTTKITELEANLRKYVGENAVLTSKLKTVTDRLRFYENPEPDPPHVLPKTGTDE